MVLILNCLIATFDVHSIFEIEFSKLFEGIPRYYHQQNCEYLHPIPIKEVINEDVEKDWT